MDYKTAVGRTPVEIWRMIFTFALRTWLLPEGDNRLVDDLLLFNNGCRSYAEYKRVEDIRRQLRLVCKSWNAILRDAGVTLTISNFHDYTLPSMSTLPHSMRIESPARICCKCRTKCPHNRIIKAQLESLAATTDVGDSLKSAVKKPGSAHIILLSRSSQSQNAILDALQYAQRMQALECNSSFLCKSQVPKPQ
ncbi:hypothetical protein FRC17_007024, partial [Serendipita sp. 399]